ncbi:MAG: hypothetical protein EXS43_12260 [Opitutus sp.]|nr:hypothetical protein [Opitutus sp.]
MGVDEYGAVLIRTRIIRLETLLAPPLQIRDGFVDQPTRPGLGIELDEKKVEAQRFNGRWDNPRWANADGGPAEW